ncbi:Cof-type HAD-IIB family hydrolase [Cytobacillus sp. Hm23]
MYYRLLAINIDGTLLRSNGRLQKGVKEAIQFVQNKDVYVTLVTGRNFLSAQKVAKALKIDSVLVTLNGAFIANSIDRPIYVNGLSEERTFNIVQVLENYDCNIRLIHEKFSLGNRKKATENIVAKAVLNSGDPLFYPLQFVDSLGDHVRDNPVSALKIEVYFPNKDEKKKVEETISKAFPTLSILAHIENKIEIIPEGVSKLNGLKKLGEHIGIQLNEMVAIGYALDDLPIVKQVGLGVAMWDSPNEVKKAADWITRTSNQQGVTYMIKEHFRKQQRKEFLREVSRSGEN